MTGDQFVGGKDLTVSLLSGPIFNHLKFSTVCPLELPPFNQQIHLSPVLWALSVPQSTITTRRSWFFWKTKNKILKHLPFEVHGIWCTPVLSLSSLLHPLQSPPHSNVILFSPLWQAPTIVAFPNPWCPPPAPYFGHPLPVLCLRHDQYYCNFSAY